MQEVLTPAVALKRHQTYGPPACPVIHNPTLFPLLLHRPLPAPPGALPSKASLGSS